MKKSKSVKQVFLVFSAIMMLSVVSAQAAPYLELTGPDVVQLGHVATYSVKTLEGTDSSYTWGYTYVTNDAATISQEGVLTTTNPGLFKVKVYGNDTFAQAELLVQVVPNEKGGVVIAGPDEVAVGGKIILTATTGGTPGSYSWSFNCSASGQCYKVIKWAPVAGDENAVEIEGIGEGWVDIQCADRSGLFDRRRVNVVSHGGKPVVSICAGLGEYFALALTLNIEGNIPADAILYIAVQWDGVIHYLPTLSTTPTPFRTNPTETFGENVLSVPLVSVPYNTYTFYAAIMDSQFQFVSNLASSTVQAGTQKVSD